MLSLARTAEEETAAPEEIATAKVLRLVGTGKRVLVLGGAVAPLHRALRAQGCDVTHVSGSDAGGELLLAGEATAEGYNVAVAAGALEYQRDPLALLRTVRRHLRQDGFLVAVVPNVAHGSVRLTLLAGRFPFGEKGAFHEAPLRFFTHESLISLFEEAQFAVAAVDRQEEEVRVPDGVAPDLLESVRGTEARTARFIALAYPLPWDGLGWVQARLRELVEQHAAAREEAEELRQDLDAVNDHVRLLVEQQEVLIRKEKQLRSQLLACHEHLLRRDDELLRRDDHLRDESARRLAAEARLNWFRRSLPGRLYKLAKNTVFLGKPSAAN